MSAIPELAAAPVLSTPDSNIFESTGAPAPAPHERLSDEQLLVTYEIQRTVDEIRAGRWKRIALQFPDHMLVNSPRIFQALSRGLKQARKDARGGRQSAHKTGDQAEQMEVKDVVAKMRDTTIASSEKDTQERLYILADTSYGACCVDEVAAEHADADVVVHYGRSCLSPTARLPVIYVFTKPPLDVEAVITSFKNLYNDKDQKIILMADIPYNSYLPEIASSLKTAGYTSIFTTDIIHNTTSPLPNRTVPEDVTSDASSLHFYHLFHIADPPPSLLLTLSSRVASIQILPILSSTTSPSSTPPKSYLSTSHLALRRRYALLTLHVAHHVVSHPPIPATDGLHLPQPPTHDGDRE